MAKDLFDGILFHPRKLNDVIVLGGDEDTGADYDESKVVSKWSSDGSQLLHNRSITLEGKEYAPDDNGMVRLPKEKLAYLTKMQRDGANIYLCSRTSQITKRFISIFEVISTKKLNRFYIGTRSELQHSHKMLNPSRWLVIKIRPPLKTQPMLKNHFQNVVLKKRFRSSRAV